MGDTLDRVLAVFAKEKLIGENAQERVSALAAGMLMEFDSENNPVSAHIVKHTVPEGEAEIDATLDKGRAEVGGANADLTMPFGMTDMDGDRKRGEAGPGHRRRTNKQIAEDDVYFAAQKARADAAIAEMEKGVDVKLSATDAAAINGTLVTNTSAISTGEPRVNPEDEAQDAADEAAESEAAKTPDLTHEDLRAAIGRFTKTHGIVVAQKRVPELLGCPVIEFPTNRIADAIAVIDAEAAKPPEKAEQKFTPVDTAKPHAQKEDVEEAMRVYARKYDGTDDPKLMVFTAQDVPAILTKVFGPTVKVPKQIEPKTPENYGKALAAINDAINSNPFGRTPK
jgi:hypothetical protein